MTDFSLEHRTLGWMNYFNGSKVLDEAQVNILADRRPVGEVKSQVVAEWRGPSRLNLSKPKVNREIDINVRIE